MAQVPMPEHGSDPIGVLLRWDLRYLPLLVPVLARFIAVPALQIDGLYESSIGGMGQPIYRYYVAKVKNNGSAKARNSWVQLLKVQSVDVPPVGATAIAWGLDDLAGDLIFSPRDVAPHDERSEFIVALTDSFNGPASVRIARVPGEGLAYYFLVTPTAPAILTFNVVADNCASRRKSFLVAVRDEGPRTWATLTVRAEHLYSRPMRSVASEVARFRRSYFHR